MVQAFRQSTQRKSFCVLGSVKPNIGHLDRASGVAGLIKTALALHHGVIPPLLEYESPAADVDVAASPFVMTTRALPWPRGDVPRRAGVSSFGLGGTNAHVVLEEAPAVAASAPARGAQLLVWSAKSAEALERLTVRLLEWLRGHGEANLADMSFTLGTGRGAFNHRRVLVAGDVGEAVRGLEAKAYVTREQTRRSGSVGIAERAPRRAWLEAVGEAWLDGAAIDWTAVLGGERRRKVALPTYPFERKRFWIDPKPVEGKGEAKVGVMGIGVKKAAVEDWFYRSAWREAASPGPRSGPGEARAWTVIGGGALGAAVAARLGGVHHAAVEDAGSLEGARAVVHLGALDAAPVAGLAGFRAAQAAGYYGVLEGGQRQAEGELVVVTRGMRSVHGEAPCAEQATLGGLVTVLGQENVSLSTRSVDLEASGGGEVEGEAALIASECAGGGGRVVAWRSGRRWEEGFEASPQGLRAVLRDRGVYLVTGGFGPVGLTLARHLAERYRARLVLVSRRGGAGQEEQVAALEELGGEVLAVAADVGEETALRAALSAARQRFGPVNGVIHAAGVSEAAPLERIGRADAERQFRAKAEALYGLEAVLGEESGLDFCVLFSSLSSVLGGLGFAVYAAANSFMDAFVRRHNAEGRGVGWTSVAWDTWRVTGEAAAAGVGATLAAYEMSTPEALEAFERAIGGSGALVNSTGDLDARIRQWVMLESVRGGGAGGQGRADVVAGLPVSAAEWEQRMAALWKDVLGLGEIGQDDNFFDLGGNSLTGLQLVARLRRDLGRPVPAAALFEAPTIRSLAAYARGAYGDAEPAPAVAVDGLAERRARAQQDASSHAIAIVGMAGRFPGAGDVETFWGNMRQGVESIRRFSDEELLASGVDRRLLADPQYVKARPVLDDVEHFDAGFFGYTPREAELLDPQQRLFQECAWEALETAGYDPQRYGGLVGVFGGTNLNSYLMRLAMTRPGGRPISAKSTVLQNDKDALTTNVSYKLNLRGPSMAVQTFCSTSLVAVHLACRSLRHGECDLALAGGVSIRVPSASGYLYQEGDQVSPDGHCRPFDARAEGTLFGDGVGLVVLKRLNEALEDGDVIHGVIRGSAVNNDGALKVGYTAPSVVGQAAVVQAALADAGVGAEAIGYVEAHGTATRLGDPVEVASLTKAYRAGTSARGYCALGSVKSNVGHLDRAAGVTGPDQDAGLSLAADEIPPTAQLHGAESRDRLRGQPVLRGAGGTAVAADRWSAASGRGELAGGWRHECACDCRGSAGSGGRGGVAGAATPGAVGAQRAGPGSAGAASGGSPGGGAGSGARRCRLHAGRRPPSVRAPPGGDVLGCGGGVVHSAGRTLRPSDDAVRLRLRHAGAADAASRRCRNRGERAGGRAGLPGGGAGMCRHSVAGGARKPSGQGCHPGLGGGAAMAGLGDRAIATGCLRNCRLCRGLPRRRDVAGGCAEAGRGCNRGADGSAAAAGRASAVDSDRGLADGGRSLEPGFLARRRACGRRRRGCRRGDRRGASTGGWLLCNASRRRRHARQPVGARRGGRLAGLLCRRTPPQGRAADIPLRAPALLDRAQASGLDSACAGRRRNARRHPQT